MLRPAHPVVIQCEAIYDILPKALVGQDMEPEIRPSISKVKKLHGKCGITADQMPPAAVNVGDQCSPWPLFA